MKGQNHWEHKHHLEIKKSKRYILIFICKFCGAVRRYRRSWLREKLSGL